MSFSDEPLRLGYVTYLLTQRCNLKCKLCTQYSPYYDKPQHSSLEQLKQETDALFEFVAHIDRLTLSGGEILLRKDLSEFLSYLSRYDDRFTELRLYTNGSIVPQEQLLSALTPYKEKLFVVVDNYGPALSRKIDAIHRALARQGLAHEVRDYFEDLHASGWVDLTDFTEKHDPKNTAALYARCSIATDLICVEYIGGALNICAFSRRCKELGVVHSPTEHVDLFDPSSSLAQKRRIVESWSAKEYLSACAFCSGRCEDSQRFTPAEQMG